MSEAKFTFPAKPFNGTIAPGDVATLIMALELFVPPAEAKAPPSDVAAFDLKAANPMEWQFLQASWERLTGLLAAVRAPAASLALTASAAAPAVSLADKSLLFVTSTTAAAVTVLTVSDVSGVVKDLRAYVNEPGKFDFAFLIEEGTRATCAAICQWLTDKRPADQKDFAAVQAKLQAKTLQAIKPEPIAFNGGEMAPYEVSTSTTTVVQALHPA
jgi:hypothetical protein